MLDAIRDALQHGDSSQLLSLESGARGIAAAIPRRRFGMSPEQEAWWAVVALAEAATSAHHARLYNGGGIGSPARCAANAARKLACLRQEASDYVQFSGLPNYDYA